MENRQLNSGTLPLFVLLLTLKSVAEATMEISPVVWSMGRQLVKGHSLHSEELWVGIQRQTWAEAFCMISWWPRTAKNKMPVLAPYFSECLVFDKYSTDQHATLNRPKKWLQIFLCSVAISNNSFRSWSWIHEPYCLTNVSNSPIPWFL